MNEVRLIDANALKEKWKEECCGCCENCSHCMTGLNCDLIDNAPTVESEEMKEIRDICEHWNDNSSSFVSACNAFEDILHIFKMGVGDMQKGGAE